MINIKKEIQDLEYERGHIFMQNNIDVNVRDLIHEHIWFPLWRQVVGQAFDHIAWNLPESK